MPSCPCRFPNGQGDVAKLLKGEKNCEEWNKEHGSIYRVWSGTTPEIVLTRRKDIKKVFKDSNTHLKAVNNDAGWLMSQSLGQCLGLVSGVEWRGFTHPPRLSLPRPRQWEGQQELRVSRKSTLLRFINLKD
jgi:hypothetical protein